MLIMCYIMKETRLIIQKKYFMFTNFLNLKVLIRLPVDNLVRNKITLFICLIKTFFYT